jgi:DNA-damage-inducible protein J
MASKTTNVTIRMNTDLKKEAEELFDELGMNLSTAFNVFVRQVVREGKIPFEISTKKPNSDTIAALLEAERIAKDPSVKGFDNLEELFANLRK